MTTATYAPTLADRLVAPSLLRNVALAVAGSLALWLSAKIQVPFTPVPMTMQTLVVLGIGAAFGWRLGGATVLLYLAEGAAGLPVFAGTPEKGLGLAYMVGPTGGFLAGFLLAAMVTGALAARGWDRSPATTFLAMLAGNVVIFGLGTLWLGTVIGWDKPVLALAVTPFLLGELVKMGLGAALLPLAWRVLGR